MKIVKEFYRYIKLGMLWYNLFSETLCKIGFDLNSYDLCVANKFVSGKNCTITWYVDNLKISHVESSIEDDFIKDVESYFGKITATRGLKHKYVGI